MSLNSWVKQVVERVEAVLGKKVEGIYGSVAEGTSSGRSDVSLWVFGEPGKIVKRRMTIDVNGRKVRVTVLEVPPDLDPYTPYPDIGEYSWQPLSFVLYRGITLDREAREFLESLVRELDLESMAKNLAYHSLKFLNEVESDGIETLWDKIVEGKAPERLLKILKRSLCDTLPYTFALLRKRDIHGKTVFEVGREAGVDRIVELCRRVIELRRAKPESYDEVLSIVREARDLINTMFPDTVVSDLRSGFQEVFRRMLESKKMNVVIESG